MASAGQQALHRTMLQLRHMARGSGQQQLWPGQLAAMSTQAQGAARYKDSFLSPPASLEADRGRVQYPPQLENNPLGRGLLRLVGAYGKKQQLSNGASILYHSIVEQSEDARLMQALGFDPEAFMSVHSMLVVHMWLVINRLKQEDDASTVRLFQQLLYTDYFYKDVERRVYKEGVKVHVSKWLKKLEQYTYGSWVAFDTALSGERSQLVDALVKNMYGGDASFKPYAQLTAKYMNRELACLQLTPAEAIYKGHVKFSSDVKVAGGS